MSKKARKRIGVSIELSVMILREGDYFVAYSPALDFSTCGKTFSEAQRMFDEGSRIFLSELVKMGTLEEVLLECGWRKSSHPKPRLIPPTVVASTQQEVKIPCRA